MKVLITGGAGFIGTTLTRLLLERGDTVRAFDNLTFGFEPLIPFFRHPRYELVEGDLVQHSERLKRSLQDVDAIVHLAAIVGAPACRANPDLARRVNVEGTRILNLVRNGHPVIYASTGSNYGAVPDGVCTEDTPLNPLSEYGITKTEAERLLFAEGNVVGYRFATAFGLSPRLRLDLLVNDFCYRAVREKTLILYEAEFMRTFIHVHDIARAILHALDCYPVMRDQVYNCGSNRLNASKLDVVKLIKQHVPDFYWHVPDRSVGKDPDQRNYTVSYDKLAATGYETTVSLEEGIAEMVKAFQYVRVENRYSNVG